MSSPAPGDVRPRYGRLAAFGIAVAVTGTAVLGGAGVLPVGSSASYAEARTDDAAALTGQTLTRDATGLQPDDAADVTATPSPPAGALPATEAPAAPDAAEDVPLPAASGTGRRAVFAMSDQRVWLVGRDGRVRRTYLVSGSLSDNLAPGDYEVYSRSRHAVGIDGSTMDYMVRFAHGDHAAIGFHDIPVMFGRLVQTTAELGTPQSHGCIRQAEADARAMWRFAAVGTRVVVTA